MNAQLRCTASALAAMVVACGTDLPVEPATLQPPRVPSFDASAWSSWSEPMNLGAVVNSAGNEIAPEIAKDGLSLYFGSDRPGGLGGNDIYVSRRASTDDPWGPAVNLGPTINSTANEAGIHVTRDGHWMYFTSTRGPSQGAASYGGNDLFVSWRADVHDDFAWETPVNLGAPPNSERSDLGGSIWGPELYFWRGDPGPNTNGDIYLSVMTGSVFGDPVRVDALSSAQHDERPSIRFDGREIFFSSSRSGNHDLWFATRDGNGHEWNAPLNVGEPVNSASEDRRPAISGDGVTLFFDSNRPGGVGGRDLYMTTRTRTPDSP
jgi:hypothetical protein